MIIGPVSKMLDSILVLHNCMLNHKAVKRNDLLHNVRMSVYGGLLAFPYGWQFRYHPQSVLQRSLGGIIAYFLVIADKSYVKTVHHMCLTFIISNK